MDRTVLEQARLYASVYAGKRNTVLVSDKVDPTTAPTAETLADAVKPAANGRKVVTAQKAAVEYLSDADKLVLPTGLFSARSGIGSGGYEHARLMYKSVLELAGMPSPVIDDLTAHADVSAVENKSAGTAPWCGQQLFGYVPAPGSPDTVGGVFEVTHKVGDYNEAGVYTARSPELEECFGMVTIQWGADATDMYVAMTNIDKDVVQADSLLELLRLDKIREQLADFLSRCCGANMSVMDAGCMELNAAEMRWNDVDVQTSQDETRYSSKLTAYTVSIIAALNLAALGGSARNAWTRAYGTSAGLLPSDASIHGKEYVLTDVMPDDSELKAVNAAHPDGEEAERYQRGCMSLIGAFGMMHLGNDHTYKNNDETLKRKAAVLVQGCRTTLDEGESDLLSSNTGLVHTIRTTSHPFGLSSTLAVAYDGRSLGFIAEALSIRDSVVPPVVAKVGVVVSQVSKLFSLPIGQTFRTAVGTKHTALETLQRDVVRHATAYSALHKHYGHDAQRFLSSDQNKDADNLMPLATAYARVFCVSEDDTPNGAALSYCVQNCYLQDGPLVDLYAGALVKYVEGAQNIKDLMSGGTTATATVPST